MGKARAAEAAACLMSLLIASGPPAQALETERLKVQRKEVFEFTEKPKVAREGDWATITFAVKDFCDATVAIENAEGKIVRHLASGVLGKNAPAPFQKDALKQTVVWDGKDEIGRYVDDQDSHTIRVSLGLKGQMERTLFWSSQRMSDGGSYLLMRAAPEGVYVFSAGKGDQLRLFDHDGNYVRTVYPFPADKIEKVKGLKWLEFPPNSERLPSKLIDENQDGFLPDRDIRWMDVVGNRICLVGAKAVFMATDGSTGGMDLAGPVVGYEVEKSRLVPGAEEFVRPNGAALSPDGKRLYLTCYTRLTGRSYDREWYHCANVVDLGTDGKMAPFAGVIQGKKGAEGSDNAHFRCPMSVACDAKGRVYVADNFNNRVQVYLPDGTFYKSVPVERPGVVRVSPKTGEIYVVSSDVGRGYGGGGYAGLDGRIDTPPPHTKPPVPTLTVLGPVDDPKPKASYALDIPGFSYARFNYVLDANAEVDFFTDPPTLWTSVAADAPAGPPAHKRSNIRLWKPDGGKLVLKRDFAAEAEKTLVRSRAWKYGRPRMAVDPTTGLLYLGLMTWDTVSKGVSFSEVVVIDPGTGRIKVEALPTDPEDLAFDWKGQAYLRTYNAVTRFQPGTWREVPFDYGEERTVLHGGGGGGEKPYRAASTLVLPSGGQGSLHLGGMGVSPQGDVVASCINPNDPRERDRLKKESVTPAPVRTAYTATLYPGRNPGHETHLFDTYGRLVKADVAPGIGWSDDLEIDRDNNVYLLGK